MVDLDPEHHGTGGVQMKRYYVNQEGAAGLHGRAHPLLHGNAGHQGGESDLLEILTRETQYAPAFEGG